MSDSILAQLVLDVAASFVWDTGKYGLARLSDRTAVAHALDATAASFPDLEDLRHTLAHWCETREFQ
jgi:hypothetical protein